VLPGDDALYVELDEITLEHDVRTRQAERQVKEDILPVVEQPEVRGNQNQLQADTRVVGGGQLSQRRARFKIRADVGWLLAFRRCDRNLP